MTRRCAGIGTLVEVAARRTARGSLRPSEASAGPSDGHDARWRLAQALINATRAVADAGDDLDGALDAVAEQARRLLWADDAGIHLTAPDGTGFVRRRTHDLARPGSPAAQPGTRVELDAFLTEMMTTRRAVFAADFRGDPRIDPASKPNAPTLRSVLAVPLVAADAMVGVLFALWASPRALSRAEVEAAEALGRHAATAVRTARLLDETRAMRAQLISYFEAADDLVLVFATDGRLVRANPTAEEWSRTLLGRLPTTFAEARFLISGPAGPEGPSHMFDRVRSGSSVTAEVVVGDHHFHVRASPVWGPGGAVRAVMMIARDVTDFRRAISRQARLDGALKTARLAAHELNNRLQLLAGYGRILPTLDPAEMPAILQDMADAAAESGAVLNRMQGMLRFEEVTIGGQTVLDLDASTDTRSP